MRPLALGLTATAAVAAGLPSNALASAPARVVGHVYVDDNTAGVNTIAGYNRLSDGTLTPLPGSPFSAGGTGTGAGFPSQGAIQISSDGRYVLAVDAGSNQVSSLRILPGGGLQLAGIASSGGVKPVSIGEHNGLVYVANQGAGVAGAVNDGTDVSGLVLGFGGRLSSLPGSTVTFPATSNPGDVVFNATGRNLIVPLIGSSQIASFTVGFGGRLNAAPGSLYTGQGLGQFGSAFSPTNPSQLFVANAHNGAGLGTISAYNVSPFDGSLNSIGASPFANQQTAPCWVTISPNGRFLYDTNTASGTLSSWSIAPNGTLTNLGNLLVSGGKGASATDTELSPDGSLLYVDQSKAGSVGSFSVNGGTVTEITSTPLPAGVASGAPAGVAVN